LVIHDLPCLIATPSLATPGRDAVGFSPLAAGLSMRIDYRRNELTLAHTLPESRDEVELPLWFYRLATVRGAVDADRAGRFIVDTGAAAISIASHSAAEASVRPGTRRIPLSVFGLSGRDRDACLLLGADLAIGPIALQRIPLVVLDLRTPGERLGYRVRGIVGQQFLRRYRVSIDLQRGVLGLSKGG
jgi:hypothetical protein